MWASRNSVQHSEIQTRREESGCPTQDPVPMLGSARAREDRQIHVELEGTRILRSSEATPHRQTVIIIHNSNFS